jgi:class 3 adenylate cyclase
LKEADTTPAKYVFLDVVGFTNRRSVEAQADIVGILNSIVSSCLTKHGIPDNERILLPTGDGICIALLNIENPYDIHIQLALSILEILDGHNTTSDVDDMRRFEVRIGISANTDNLVTDINGKQNMAGAGINEAQRVMGNADGGQILVSQTVYSTLRDREKYMWAFDQYAARIKHGSQLTMYQLILEDRQGLNVQAPSSLKPPPKPDRPEPRLNRRLAYYMAHAIQHKQIILENNLSDDNAVAALLHFLAQDSEEQADATVLDTVDPNTYKAGEASFVEQYNYYAAIDRNVMYLLYEFIADKYFYNQQNYKYFHQTTLGVTDYRFVNDTGMRKLKNEWPNIWEQFRLSTYEER